MPAARTVANPRSKINRPSGGGAVGSLDTGKLQREMQRLKNGASKMTDSLMEFNTPKVAWGAIKQGKVKPEQTVELAFNLRLIPDQLSTTANQAMELIQQAATSDLGSFDVTPVRQVAQHQAAPVQVTKRDGMRPLSKDERRHAKKLEMRPEEYLMYIASNPDIKTPLEPIKLIPLKTAQGNDAFTGNGLKEPNQVGSDENQQETMRSLPRQEKYEYQNRSSDVTQTDSDNEPVHDGSGAPTRHARETPAQKVARLQIELEQAQREARQVTYLDKIQTKLAGLNEGQLAEVEEVINDLYASAAVDKVDLHSPVDRVVKGEVVSTEDIDNLLGGIEHEDS